MGMSASQARLLSLTSRLHDVEYKAQNIQSQKIALATQKDELYEDYCAALDATKIQVAYFNDDATTRYVDACYATVCKYNPACKSTYTLKDNTTGKILVPEETKDVYEKYPNDKYSFAWAMLGFGSNFSWPESGRGTDLMGAEVGVNNKGFAQANYTQGGTSSTPGYEFMNADGTELYMTQSEGEAYKYLIADDPILAEKYNKIATIEDDRERQKALDDFRDYLYQKHGGDVYEMMNINKNDTVDSPDKKYDFPDLMWNEIQGEFNYYVNLFSAIQEAGGCVSMEAGHETGEDGEIWFQNMVESGRVTIMEYTSTGANKGWHDTSVATSTSNGYLQSVQDETDLKKAEAKYEHELDIINDKDSEFDMELSKLETERTAITTEMDSIKKVRDDNIERTFGIFS